MVLTNILEISETIKYLSEFYCNLNSCNIEDIDKTFREIFGYIVPILEYMSPCVKKTSKEEIKQITKKNKYKNNSLN